MCKMDLDIDEVCNSIRNYDMFNEKILNYFSDIYDIIEEIRIRDDDYYPDSPNSFKKESLQVFEHAISERFSIIQANIPEKLRVIVEKELLKMLDEAFEKIITVSDISNEIWKKLVDVASDIYIDFYRRYVKV